MVLPLASRFAVLPVDDDGDTSKRITLKSLKKKQEQEKTQNTGTVPKKTDVKKKLQAKKKNDQVQPVQPSKQKSKQKSGDKKPSDDWEQWKKKDAEFVDGSYENDLHQAMLLSKIDYEENKDFYKQKIVEEKEGASKKNKKSNKAQPMPLSQFIQMGENENKEVKPDNDPAEVNGKPDADPEFFDRVKSEAKKVFKSEQAEEQRKAREPMIDEIISLAQYKDRLEKSQEEMEQLRTENEGFRDQLLEVKKRNKKLCHLLLTGEMKDKAEVLLEVDRLQEMNNELNTNVKRLVEQLEQEQSKVKSLLTGDSKANHKNKKRTDSK